MELSERMKEAEFNALRTEILKHENDGRNNSMAMYAGLFIVFAYMFTSKDADPIGYLLLIPMIFTFYIKGRKSRLYADIISNYLYVFGNEYHLKWESRFERFKEHPELYNNEKLINASKLNFKDCNYIIPIIICIIAYISKIFYCFNSYSLYQYIWYISIGIIGIIASIKLIIAIKHDKSMTFISKEQMKKWIEIKYNENSNDS